MEKRLASLGYGHWANSISMNERYSIERAGVVSGGTEVSLQIRAVGRRDAKGANSPAVRRTWGSVGDPPDSRFLGALEPSRRDGPSALP